MGASSLLLACSQGGGSAPDGPVLRASVRPAGDALDLLVVIDSSEDNFAEQQSLGDALPLLVRPLLDPGAGRQGVADLHAGVVDADLGDGGHGLVRCDSPSGGALLGVAEGHQGCPTLDRPFTTHDPREPNDGGPDDPDGSSVLHDLWCLLVRGRDGCEYEQILASLRLALNDRVADGTNAGFFRDGALLAVVLMTDEDDCSASDARFFDLRRDDLPPDSRRCWIATDELEPVAGFAEMLLAARPAGRVVAAGWIPVPAGWDRTLDDLQLDPELDWRTATWDDFVYCATSLGARVRAPRLAEFMLLLGDDGLTISNCEGEGALASGMEALADLVLARLDPLACLPSAPPEGSRCEVTLRLLDPSASRCPEGTTELEPGACALGVSQWELVSTSACTELRATPEIEVPPGAALEMECFGGESRAR